MKNTLLLALLLITANIYSQCGVYLTADDYINGKLTDECAVASIPSGPGEDDRVVMLTKSGKKAHLFTKIWGYKDKLSEYRILNGMPHIIVCKGAIYAFTPYGPITRSGKKVTYTRRVVGFGEISVTSDLRSKNVTTMADYSELWKLMDPVYLKQVKDYFAAVNRENGGVMPIPEQIINYYNSLLPGYVAPEYTTIKVNVEY